MGFSLEAALSACRKYTACGKVASYIPELQKSDPRHLGICLLSCSGEFQQEGDWNVPFTIQSVVKPILLLNCTPKVGQESQRKGCRNLWEKNCSVRN